MLRRALLSFPLGATAALAPGSGLRVGVEDHEDFLPYSDYHRRTYRGLIRDLLDAFGEQQRLSMHYVVLPIKRRNALFVQGELDLMVPDHPQWAPEVKGKLPVAYTPVIEFTDGAVVMPQRLGQGLAKVRRLGIQNGFTPFPFKPWIDRGQVMVEESGRPFGLLEKLRSGHIDAAYLNVRVAAHFFGKLGLSVSERPRFDPDLPHVNGHWHLSSIRHPELVDAFGAFLQRHPELLDQCKRRWGWDTLGMARHQSRMPPLA